jgi:hypothetical protein
LKPQALDLYSPNILAAIMGFENILAICYIALPVHRSTHRLFFSIDFEAMYRNYFEHT